MRQAITGFHRDEAGDWVAELACGHCQHVRHRPPWINRSWVVSEAGRRRAIGRELNCKHCDTDAGGWEVKGMSIRVKRIYDGHTSDDGTRILVDRIWPRGLSKEDAAVDHWLRDVAPSSELRKWFGHDPAKWAEFKRRYFEELDAAPEAVGRLREAIGKGDATLLFAARDESHNNAVALKEYLHKRR